MFDKDVPVPPVLKPDGRKPKFPFASMEVGDSLPVTKKQRQSAVNAVQYITKVTGGAKRFTVRAYEGGYRVWRIS